MNDWVHDFSSYSQNCEFFPLYCFFQRFVLFQIYRQASWLHIEQGLVEGYTRIRREDMSLGRIVSSRLKRIWRGPPRLQCRDFSSFRSFYRSKSDAFHHIQTFSLSLIVGMISSVSWRYEISFTNSYYWRTWEGNWISEENWNYNFGKTAGITIQMRS